LRFPRLRPWSFWPRLFVRLEAAEPLVHVGDETGFSELAIVDHVDAEIDLLAYDLLHCRAQAWRTRAFLHRSSLLAGLDRVEELRRPRQAADVGRYDALVAALHGCFLQSYPNGRDVYPPPLVSAKSLRAYSR